MKAGRVRARGESERPSEPARGCHSPSKGDTSHSDAMSREPVKADELSQEES